MLCFIGMPLANIDGPLEEVVLQNLGSLGFQNQFPWLLRRGHFVDVRNFKTQERVALLSLHFEMSFLLHLLMAMLQNL